MLGLSHLTDVECLAAGLWRARPANTAAQGAQSAFVSAQGLHVASSEIGHGLHVRMMSSFIVGRVDPSAALIYRTARSDLPMGGASLQVTALQHGRRVWFADVLFRNGRPRLLPREPQRPACLDGEVVRPLVHPGGADWSLAGVLLAASTAPCERAHEVLTQHLWLAEAFTPCTRADLRHVDTRITIGRRLHTADVLGADGSTMLTLRQECQESALEAGPWP